MLHVVEDGLCLVQEHESTGVGSFVVHGWLAVVTVGLLVFYDADTSVIKVDPLPIALH